MQIADVIFRLYYVIHFYNLGKVSKIKKKLMEFSTKRGGEGVRIGQFSTKKNIG